MTAFLIVVVAAAGELPRTKPLEQHPGIETVAGTVEGPGGQRLRTITTSPPGAGKLLSVFVVGWLSCDSVELTGTPRGVNRLIQDVVRRSGGLVFRVDKPGVGDSEGDCAKTDFAAELEGYRRAFATFRKHPRVYVARVVLLGAPVRGCHAGRRFGSRAVGRWLLGACAARWEKREARWQRPEPLGVIAGTLPLGFGRALGALPGEHDGVVCVDETVVAGMADRALVREGHSMLPVSRRVSALIEHFLSVGRFS